jgi:phosphohistidine phosphatase
MMGRRLAEQGVEVELMISSPAVRAMATAEAMAEELDYPWDGIVAEEGLYEVDAEGILTVIEEQDDWIDRLMVVGHNPDLTALANILSRSDLDNVPTCGVVQLAYDVERWMEIAEARPVRFAFDYPKKRRG